jgi:gamma-polyglutamate biosynthesis protein CapA
MTRIAAVGDIMLGDSAITVGFGMRSRYPGKSIEAVFQALSPRLQAADIAIGNLECPLTRSGIGKSRLLRDQMRGEVAYAAALKAVGFTALAIGNNHAMQHGEEGFASTVSALRAAGLEVLGLRGVGGWHCEPVVHNSEGGRTTCLLAYSWRPRQYGYGDPPYAEVNPDHVIADVKRARANHSAVIVSIHWGVEFVPLPSEPEQQFAYRLCGAGADLILGHHPHVIRPVEQHGSSFIAYSLGNCATDMLWQEELRVGLLLEARLEPRPVALGLTTLRAQDDLRVRLGPAAAITEAVAALNLDAYFDRSAAALRRQRMAAYKYLAANIHRYPPVVLTQLLASTFGNKIASVGSRIFGGK